MTLINGGGATKARLGGNRAGRKMGTVRVRQPVKNEANAIGPSIGERTHAEKMDRIQGNSLILHFVNGAGSLFPVRSLRIFVMPLDRQAAIPRGIRKRAG